MKPINRIENDENYSDRNDKILPAVSVSFKDNEMSLFSDLFGIRTGSRREIWRVKRRTACRLEDFKVAILFPKEGMIRSRKPESKSRRKYH